MKVGKMQDSSILMEIDIHASAVFIQSVAINDVY